MFFKINARLQEGEPGADTPASSEPPKTYTQEEFDAAVAGLKANSEKLLAEQKAAKAEAKKAAEEKLAAEQAAAKNSGELEAFEKSLRQQYDPMLAEKDAKLTTLETRILKAERSAVSNALISKGKFIDAAAADLLAPFITVALEGDDVVTKFTGPDGAVITTDVDKFIDYCKKHPVISRLMQADVGSGGGAGGNKNPTGGAGGDGDAIDRRLREKFKK